MFGYKEYGSQAILDQIPRRFGRRGSFLSLSGEPGCQIWTDGEIPYDT